MMSSVTGLRSQRKHLSRTASGDRTCTVMWRNLLERGTLVSA